MAGLGRQQLLLLENVYIKRLPRVKLNSNWRAIARQLEVGEIDAAQKYLCFAPPDFELLRQGVLTLMGLDLRALELDVDRMAMSVKSHNEKIARIRPEANYLLVKFLGFDTPTQPFSPLPLSPLSLSHLSSLRLPVDEAIPLLPELQVAAILLVENLDVFDAIHGASLPQEIRNTVVVYRGSGNHSPAGVGRFLQAIAGKMPIMAFTDLDPAGLQIAHTLGASHWLVPRLALTAPGELLAIEQINSITDFDRQHKAAKYIQHAELKGWRELGKMMIQHRLSIKQQHLLAHRLELVLLARANSNRLNHRSMAD